MFRLIPVLKNPFGCKHLVMRTFAFETLNCLIGVRFSMKD